MTHSEVFPSMSWSPQGLATRPFTGLVCNWLLAQYQAAAISPLSSKHPRRFMAPVKKDVAVPPRTAYSHSMAVGGR
jgi:hypothetical protein